MTSTPTGKIITIHDFELYYECHGEGKPLLLLHGFTGSGADLVTLFKDMGDKYTLIIPDLRGHGRSTNPSKEFTHQLAAQDITALLDHLNIEKCDAVGFSAGANILLHMALRSDRLNAMAIISATSYFPDQARELMRLFTIDAKTEADWGEMRRIHKYGDDQIRMLWKQANNFSNSYDDMNISEAMLSTIKAKTLIIQGDRDPLYPIEISVDMYRHIPNASLWIVPNSGHGAFTHGSIKALIDYLNDYLK